MRRRWRSAHIVAHRRSERVPDADIDADIDPDADRPECTGRAVRR
jgi:hypothetical protein